MILSELFKGIFCYIYKLFLMMNDSIWHWVDIFFDFHNNILAFMWCNLQIILLISLTCASTFLGTKNQTRLCKTVALFSPLFIEVRLCVLHLICKIPSSPILVTLKKEALSSYETSVLTTATWRNIPEDTILHLICYGMFWSIAWLDLHRTTLF
jgi:hypothetical protein